MTLFSVGSKRRKGWKIWEQSCWWKTKISTSIRNISWNNRNGHYNSFICLPFKKPRFLNVTGSTVNRHIYTKLFSVNPIYKLIFSCLNDLYSVTKDTPKLKRVNVSIYPKNLKNLTLYSIKSTLLQLSKLQLPLQTCENLSGRKCRISEASFPDKAIWWIHQK